MKLILFGAPGSGKGTQAIMLSKEYNIKAVSVGDILRENVKKETKLGSEAKKYMEKGLLVPDEIVARLIKKSIENGDFVLDGYPRNENQAKTLKNILTENGDDIEAFIYLEIGEEAMVNRLSKRRVCKFCGKNYHLKNMPPKRDNICDECGGELIQRRDDTPEVIKKRWEIFKNESQPVLNFYEKHNKMIKVDGRKDKDKVFEEVKAKLQ
ncbi:MAG: adenylate kinase [Candidatus Omnitrophica bacterium]|nr:adenylate kinase [Candidatus Omnitrophota bacterium]